MDEKGAVFAYNFITNQKLDSIKLNSQLEIKYR
jgi:hypothetical protein